MSRRPLPAAGGRALLLGLALAAPAAHAGRAEDKARELCGDEHQELLACKERVKVYEGLGEVCDPTSTPDPVYPELVQVFRDTPVKVSRSGSRVQVTVPAEVLYTTDDVRLREEGVFALDMVATALGSHPGHTVAVEAFTCAETPPAALKKRLPTNMEYSVARAQAAGMALITRFGVAPDRVTISGRACAEPLNPNDTDDQRRANERLVLEIRPPSPGASP